MAQREREGDRSRECKDMTHYKYFRCLISTHHSTYLLPGRERLQIKALLSCQAAFGHPPLTHKLSRTHTHRRLTRRTHTYKLLQFCNSGPPRRCVRLFGGNQKKRSSSAKPDRERQTAGKHDDVWRMGAGLVSEWFFCKKATPRVIM